MALGFGFNKAKVMAAADKYVQQGKLQNAINEYEKVVKADPNDLTVLNTIGDLCSRVGKTENAVAYFRRVGDAYAAQGFVVKAIAMYKKLAKLIPNSPETTLRLAELYSQQGLYNDARAHYIIVAESLLRSGQNEGAADLFKKMLELDPTNVAAQSKLADLYIKLGKKNDAKNIYSGAAQTLYGRGSMEAADEALRKVLSIDPANVEALLLRGQVAVDRGDFASAVASLEKIPDVETNPAALNALLKAKLGLGNLPETEVLAKKMLTLHNDVRGLHLYAEKLMAADQFEKAVELYDVFAEKLLESDPASLRAALDAAIAKVKDSAPALERLRTLFDKSGDEIHHNEITELLAHACVQQGKLERAAELYNELALKEPENAIHHQNYRQVMARLGQDSAARPLTTEEGLQPLMMDEIESPPTLADPGYAQDVDDRLKAALTDSELLSTYNLPAKAIAPLENALASTPRDVQLNTQLASLYVKANRFAEAARCCQVLSEVYFEQGHEKHSEKFLELAKHYRHQDKSPKAKPDIATPTSAASVAEFKVGDASAQPDSAAANFSEFLVDSPSSAEYSSTALKPNPLDLLSSQKGVPPPAKDAGMDLSSEWEDMVSVEGPAKTAPSSPARVSKEMAEAMEEARFYIAQSMWPQAEAALDKLHEIAPASPTIAELRAQVLAAKSAVVEHEASPAPPVAEPVPEMAEFESSPQIPAAAAEGPPVGVSPSTGVARPVESLDDFVAGLEESLGLEFALDQPPAAKAYTAPPGTPGLVSPPESAAPAIEREPEPEPEPAAMASTPTAAAPSAKAAAGRGGMTSKEQSSVLSDLFADFKEDVEENALKDEDPETHYSLGIAFKEMGLLDEAIGELQTVCHAIESGHPFRDAVPAFTWLAQCLLDKGAPQAATTWYEKALQVPGIDYQSKLAIYYDLASAHEAAGDTNAALKNFMQVYGANIDYRDVAERIKTLKK